LGYLELEIDLTVGIIKTHDKVLAKGHILAEGRKGLGAETRNLGIHRVVITHGTTMSYWGSMAVEDMM